MTQLLNSGILSGIQIVISIVLVVVILFQVSSAGTGGALGGSDSIQTFHTKRGFEKFLFIATIVLGILFAGLCVLAFVLK
ncbi:MAG: preprotein translocase subunit SecG [Candidatus Pacebacteria bacterium]|nr:preprotein translocase subunit SecG [Candidatus Paceibacterota bacterium]